MTGTYLQADPRVADSWDAYVYARSNPIRYRDSDGLVWDDPNTESDDHCSCVDTSGCVGEFGWLTGNGSEGIDFDADEFPYLPPDPRDRLPGWSGDDGGDVDVCAAFENEFKNCAHNCEVEDWRSAVLGQCDGDLEQCDKDLFCIWECVGNYVMTYWVRRCPAERSAPLRWDKGLFNRPSLSSDYFDR